RLPPELLRVQRSREVVLADLPLVETPAMVLVLFEPVPAVSLAHAEVEEVATERDVGGRLLYACDQERRAVIRECVFELGNRLRIDRGLGEDDSVDVSPGSDRVGEHRVEKVGVEVKLGSEFEKAEALEIHVLQQPGSGGPK